MLSFQSLGSADQARLYRLDLIEETLGLFDAFRVRTHQLTHPFECGRDMPCPLVFGFARLFGQSLFEYLDRDAESVVLITGTRRETLVMGTKRILILFSR